MNIAFDSHKCYTFCSVADDQGLIIDERRIEHDRGAITSYLSQYPSGTEVALETTGNWYWIVDEIEAAGQVPLLVHARKAKVMFGCVNKTDRLDARGLNRLARVGSLPTVWIPPGELRDHRDLPRTRMYLVNRRTGLKNRLHATLAKYALSIKGVSDIFAVGCRDQLLRQLDQLPSETRYSATLQLSYIDNLGMTISDLEQRIKATFVETEALRLVQTMPGVGFVSGVVITMELGDISRFPSAARFASYAGTTPRVHASGGRTRYGKTRMDVNHYLKWAYTEAGSTASRFAAQWRHRHVSRLYRRLRATKGHQKAVRAVSRHLAEATWWILSKEEAYRDPAMQCYTSTGV